MYFWNGDYIPELAEVPDIREGGGSRNFGGYYLPSTGSGWNRV